MNEYKIQIINPCQEFLDDLKKHNLPVHNQLCGSLKNLFPIHFKSKFKKHLGMSILQICIIFHLQAV